MSFRPISPTTDPRSGFSFSNPEEKKEIEQVSCDEESFFPAAIQEENFTSYRSSGTPSSAEEEELPIFELGTEVDSEVIKTPSALDQLPWHSIIETSLKIHNLTADLRVISATHAPVIANPITRAQRKVGITQFSHQPEARTAFKQEASRYFKAAFEKTLEELELGRTSEQAAVLRERGYAELDTILQHFDTEDSAISTSTLVQQVHRDMLKSLVKLKADVFRSSSHPSLQILPAEGDSWSIIRPAPLIENIAFSGGGARGVGYVPVLTALEEAELLRNLQRVAGTSVGAIISAALACGLSTETLAHLASLPVSQALSTPQETVSTQTTSPMGIFEGAYIPNLLHQETSRVVIAFFQSDSGSLETIAELQQAGTLTEKEVQSLVRFRRSMMEAPKVEQASSAAETDKEESDFKEDPENFSFPQMTFKDLALLHKMAPTRFKELTITGFNVTRQQGEYYNAQTCPEMPIIDAVRISISLPLIFRPPVNTKGESYTDGTLTSPIPAEVFSCEDQSKTLLFGFSKTGGLDRSLHAQGGTAAPAGAYVADAVIRPLYGTTLSKKMKRAAAAYYKAGPNTLKVEHGNLTAVSFLATTAQIKAAQLQAEVRAWEWIAARQHQAVHTVYDSLEKALSFCSEEELRELIQYYEAPERVRILPLSQAEILYTAQQILREKENF